MKNINIVTNISSKTQAGEPFATIDGNKCKIIEDCIYLDLMGSHKIAIGYNYASGTEGGKLINYEGELKGEENEQWYRYRVPIMLDGKGRMTRISKYQFVLLRFLRKLFNNVVFVIVAIVILIIISFMH